MTLPLPTLVRNDVFTGVAALRERPGPPGDLLRALLADASAGADRPVAAGSREHFFHFLLGYLLPVVHEQEVRGLEDFQVLDCGPLMTPLLGQVLEHLGLPFRPVPPSEVARPVFVQAWDEGWDDLSEVRRTAGRIAGAVAGLPCGHADCPRSPRLLLRRSSPHPYYMEGAAEIAGYGTARRELVNLEEISAHLAADGIEHAVYEPGSHALSCQIRTFAQAERVAGVRGAEWANLVWCSPGVGVRILIPKPPATHLEGLVRRLGIDWDFVPAHGARMLDDPVEVARFFRGSA